jgi:hypothetical protein
MKNIGTYTTHTHLCVRVFACIHHAYNKHTLSLTHARLYTQHAIARTHAHTHSHTQKNNTHAQQQHTHTHTWTGRRPDRGAPVEGSFKSHTIHTHCIVCQCVCVCVCFVLERERESLCVCLCVVCMIGYK